MNRNFDPASATYDQTFTFSKIGMAQRYRVYKNLNTIFKCNTALHILELNCGTGHDAINFAKHGHKVLATDISSGMINVAKNKNSYSNLNFNTLDINLINYSKFNENFDVIFSNFGGLNCLSPNELIQFFNNASQLLSHKGKLIIVIMPKNCLWERAYFGFKKQFEKAKRRQTKDFVLANVDGKKVKTWYYNPQEILTFSSSKFKLKNLKPVGLFVPPSYLQNSILASKFCLSVFRFLDSIFTYKRFSKYADHFLIELELK